ncbi:MAG: hypothetical protein HC832_07280 [Leptolyngbyaceae cyanobacterium RM1_405_57]|nr:hypothetical protein [Leptolyngbyaceae cyanobacterium RM1_405_57]
MTEAFTKKGRSLGSPPLIQTTHLDNVQLFPGFLWDGHLARPLEQTGYPLHSKLIH